MCVSDGVEGGHGSVVAPPRPLLPLPAGQAADARAALAEVLHRIVGETSGDRYEALVDNAEGGGVMAGL